MAGRLVPWAPSTRVLSSEAAFGALWAGIVAEQDHPQARGAEQRCPRARAATLASAVDGIHVMHRLDRLGCWRVLSDPLGGLGRWTWYLDL